MPLHLLSIDTLPALSLRLSLETVGIDGESFRCNSRFAINECHRLLHRAFFLTTVMPSVRCAALDER